MKSISIHRQGAIGAAHFGPGAGRMFGARGPLLNQVDGGNGAGAAAGETTSTTTSTTAGQPSTASAGGTGEKLIPQSQVNALIAQARREGRESTQQHATTQHATSQQTAAQTAAAAPASGQPLTVEAVQAIMSRERQFTAAIAGVGLTPTQLARTEAAFRAENPADPIAWTTSWIADMGLKPGTQAQQTTQTTTTTNGGAAGAAPQSPPAAAPNAPNATSSNALPSQGGLTDIFNLSLDQIDALGPEGLRAEHEKVLATAHRRAGAPRVPLTPQRK